MRRGLQPIKLPLEDNYFRFYLTIVKKENINSEPLKKLKKNKNVVISFFQTSSPLRV
jgi:hypothetical protein